MFFGRQGALQGTSRLRSGYPAYGVHGETCQNVLPQEKAYSGHALQTIIVLFSAGMSSAVDRINHLLQNSDLDP